ncbi:uncharacterized protein LOC112565151 isoform X2 [Pomacea canaliculata]|uniref:uncharacterized protein LOC112565151 isoform X2 n=1 Tax=Pomacea canaliculata TaxID=400727 RepID=UPI000D73DCC8|nr:uncharacterized protein LOC112565151 isoform X2 [Pomacea canaliculata]
MQSGNTLVSSQLHIPGVFSGSSSSRELCPVKGILSDRKKPPRSNKRVSFDENSLRKRKRTISLTSLKWQAYIEEQFRTLRAHRKRKSKRENGRNVFQKKPQPVPRSKNRSKKQESNGWQKTRRPREILYAERKQLYYQPEGTSHDLRRWRARWQREGGQTQATVKRILCIRSVLQKKASSRFHEIFKSRAAPWGECGATCPWTSALYSMSTLTG